MSVQRSAPDYEEGTFVGSDGTLLFRRAWHPTGEARAALVNLHGLGDHSGLYPMVSEHFVPRGIAVYMLDLRGNGRSGGQRGYIGSWRELREDLRLFIAAVQRQELGPLFLLGNSLGGVVALDFCLHYPDTVRGVIAISPPLGSLGVPHLLLLLGRVLSRVWPRFSLETGLDLSGLAHDPDVRARIVADPLFHRRGTARLSTELAATSAGLKAAAPHFPRPVLLVHGGADRLVSPDGSRAFIARVGHPDKRLLEIPDGYHVLLADRDAERVFAELTGWVESRT